MLAFFTVLIILASDQLSKFFILKNFSLGQSYPVIKDIFHLTLVFNPGIAFGLFSKSGNFIWVYLIAVSALVFIFLYLQRQFGSDKTGQFFLSLILSGALGNLIDRFRFGYVVDFLDFRIWPVFNLADLSITVGVILFSLQLIRNKTPSSANSRNLN